MVQLRTKNLNKILMRSGRLVITQALEKNGVSEHDTKTKKAPYLKDLLFDIAAANAY